MVSAPATRSPNTPSSSGALAHRTNGAAPPHTLPLPPGTSAVAGPHFSSSVSLQGLLEPVARKRARPVLRGPGRSNTPRLPDEIYFSVVQRKLLTPDNVANLDTLSDQLTAFEARYNRAAQPFDWRFNREDLNRLLDRIAA